MKLFLFFILLLPLTALAIETDLSGNIEGQVRQSRNNQEAKEDLFQNWNNENFYLVYGNLNGKVEFQNSRIEANWFVRHSQSDLYDPGNGRDPYLATQIYTFPNKLVARDVFKLQQIDQHGNQKTESILNKLYYELDFDDNRFMFGRIYVNYGQGEIFNPINPFNQPTGLTAISQVAQGNDGFSFTYFVSDKHTVEFLLLGDKRIEGYEGQIDKTLWAHGEYQATENLQLDYVIGEDQQRDKLGGQASYRFSEAMAFTQVLYQSQNIKDEPSNNLWDVMFGYDQQLTGKWHLRAEGGYQKTNRYLTPDTFERFLPTEYFVAVANVYEIHPLVKLTGTLINDIKSGFTYAIGKATVDLGHNTEAEIFGFSPVAKGSSVQNPAQKLVTTDIGMAVRAFF